MKNRLQKSLLAATLILCTGKFAHAQVQVYDANIAGQSAYIETGSEQDHKLNSNVVENTGALTTGIKKKPMRFMVGIGAYSTKEEDNYTYPEKSVKGAIEWVNPKNGFLGNNVGLGLASNSLLDIFIIKYIGYTDDPDGGRIPDGPDSYSETVYSSKHYLTGYIFKEFDSKFASTGLSAGPSLNYTRGTYGIQSANSYTSTDTEVSYFTFGLHTGQYIQRYLSTNKKEEKAFFIRIGFDQYIMLEGKMTSTISLTFGI